MDEHVTALVRIVNRVRNERDPRQRLCVLTNSFMLVAASSASTPSSVRGRAAVRASLQEAIFKLRSVAQRKEQVQTAKGQLGLRHTTAQRGLRRACFAQALEERSTEIVDVIGSAVGQRVFDGMPAGFDGAELGSVGGQAFPDSSQKTLWAPSRVAFFLLPAIVSASTPRSFPRRAPQRGVPASGN